MVAVSAQVRFFMVYDGEQVYSDDKKRINFTFSWWFWRKEASPLDKSSPQSSKNRPKLRFIMELRRNEHHFWRARWHIRWRQKIKKLFRWDRVYIWSWHERFQRQTRSWKPGSCPDSIQGYQGHAVDEQVTEGKHRHHPKKHDQIPVNPSPECKIFRYHRLQQVQGGLFKSSDYHSINSK